MPPLCRLLLVVAALFGWATVARADLARYVSKPDDSFKWKLVKTRTAANGTVFDIELTSQTWQGIVWKHDLMVVVPTKVSPRSTLVLWNQGGRPGVASTMMAFDLATRAQAPVAFLFGVPNQPLLGGKREDGLIAETFVRYLSTKDADWPLLFPMVKSLVKAMDALQAFARQEWKIEVKDFVVCGASKRGWTTWLTGATDKRVKAIMPLVIDTLNMRAQLPYQLKSYGAYSAMIRDYTQRKLVPMPDTPEAKRLWNWVDPWSYRARLTMPKLILNGTNDPYWTQDALNLYWDDLVGPKWLCYVPNAGHNLAQKDAGQSRALNVMAAFARAYVHDKPLPKLTWKHSDAGGKYALSVTSDVTPQAVRLWSADAPTRDFRKAQWQNQTLTANRSVTATVEPPASGCRVFLVECEYEQDGLRFTLCTQLRIVEAAKK